MPFTKPLRPDSYVQQTLLRYTGSEHGQFKRFVLLTNFSDYVERFKALGDHVYHSRTWEAAHNDDLDCSLVSFGIGAPAAAMVMHCLGYLDQVDAVIMLGLAGGLAEEMQIGDMVLPTASIRDEGASQHYLHSNTPALPNFKVQHVIQQTALEMGIKSRSGIFKTTDYRMWEFDQEFAGLLKAQKVVAIDMEIAALFSVGYALRKPIGAVMLISDLPLLRTGIKRSESTGEILEAFCQRHLDLGIHAVKNLNKDRLFKIGDVLSFEW
jgi:AMP nucleosidase